MKIRTLIAGQTALFLAATIAAQAADQMTTFASARGSKMRIEGTSNIHDWQVESPFIRGMLEVGPGFPMAPGQAATPGKMDAHVSAMVQARSLNSIEKDGRKYSDSMDGIMWEHLKADKFPTIYYRLTELVLKEAPKSPDAPYLFDSKGDLAIAGVTNTISMPVSILPQADKKLKIAGSTTLKMTDFKIEPPAPKLALGLIKTGDAVKIIFEWMVAPRPAAAGPAASK